MKRMLRLATGLAIGGLAMAAVITVQMILTFGFTYEAGELFSKVAVSALFYWSVIQLVKKRKLKEEK